MADDGQRPIIVKRIKKGGHGHHGGAWKIAYADFVTAMMAFFLLMWLLGSTTKGDLEGIAEYFKTPLKVAMQGGSGSGDSSSIIQGGGKDLTRRNGQVKKGDDRGRQEDLRPEGRARRARARGSRAPARAEGNDRADDRRQSACCKQVQEPAAARHHQRRPAHPDRRREEPADVRAAPAPSCSPTPATSCDELGTGAERRAEPHQPVRPHRFDAVLDGERATATGSCRPTAPTPRAANWCTAAWPTTRSCAWWAWPRPSTSTARTRSTRSTAASASW